MLVQDNIRGWLKSLKYGKTIRFGKYVAGKNNWYGVKVNDKIVCEGDIDKVEAYLKERL